MSVASELVSRGGFLSSEIWYTTAISVVFWESDYLLRITSNPWSWDLKWICHTFTYFSQMQQFTLFFYAFLWSRRKDLIWTPNIRLEWNGICYSLAIAMWFFWPGDIYTGRFLLKEDERFYFSPLFWFSVIWVLSERVEGRSKEFILYQYLPCFIGTVILHWSK